MIWCLIKISTNHFLHIQNKQWLYFRHQKLSKTIVQILGILLLRLDYDQNLRLILHYHMRVCIEVLEIKSTKFSFTFSVHFPNFNSKGAIVLSYGMSNRFHTYSLYIWHLYDKRIWSQFGDWSHSTLENALSYRIYADILYLLLFIARAWRTCWSSSGQIKTETVNAFKEM